jgi:hypothetical protein
VKKTFTSSEKNFSLAGVFNTPESGEMFHDSFAEKATFENFGLRQDL